MSWIGNFEENIDLSRIHSAVIPNYTIGLNAEPAKSKPSILNSDLGQLFYNDLWEHLS